MLVNLSGSFATLGRKVLATLAVGVVAFGTLCVPGSAAEVPQPATGSIAPMAVASFSAGSAAELQAAINTYNSVSLPQGAVIELQDIYNGTEPNNDIITLTSPINISPRPDTGPLIFRCATQSGSIQLHAGASRHFTVTGSTAAHVYFEQDITLAGLGTGGGIQASTPEFSLTGGLFQACKSTGNGGAVQATGNLLLISGSRFENNTAQNGGAVAYLPQSGQSPLMLADSTFLRNTASMDGGAVYTSGATGTLAVCTFENNTAIHGGAVALKGPGSLALAGCTVKNNTAATTPAPQANWGEAGYLTGAKGGGLYLSGAPCALALTGTSITGNTADYGGGIFVSEGVAPGDNRVLTTAGPANTISNNTATQYGGGIYADHVHLEGATMASNSARCGGAVAGGSLEVLAPFSSIPGYDPAAPFAATGGLHQVTFSGNQAAETTAWSTATPPEGAQFARAAALSASQVMGTNFTSPFTNAFNNADVVFPTVRYTVAFEANGGSAVPAQQVAAMQKASQPATPTRQGYTFSGWYADTTLTAAWSFDTPVSRNTTLHAKWNASASSSSSQPASSSSSSSPPSSSTPASSSSRPVSSSSPPAPASSSPATVPNPPGSIASSRPPVSSRPASSSAASSSPVSDPVSSAPASSSLPPPSSQPLPGDGGGTSGPSGGTTPEDDPAVQAQFQAQTGNPFTDILNGNVPLGGLDFTEAWSLVSLVLALLGLVGSVAVGLALLLRRRKAAQQDETPPRRGTVLGLGGVVLGLLAGVLFLALDKLSAPMVFINRWTPLIAAALLVHVAAAILYLLARRQEKQQGTLYDDDEAGPPAHEGG